jgi:hypothetical protein
MAPDITVIGRDVILILVHVDGPAALVPVGWNRVIPP